MRRRDRLALREGDDAAVLRAVGAQQARQAARVDAGDADRVLAPQVVAERRAAAKVRRARRHVLDDQPGGEHLRRLDVFARWCRSCRCADTSA